MSGIGESSLHSEYHLRPYSVVKDRHATPMMRVACDELSVETGCRRSKENIEGEVTWVMLSSATWAFIMDLCRRIIYAKTMRSNWADGRRSCLTDNRVYTETGRRPATRDHR